MAKEFGPKEITINAIAPGPIATELFMNGKSDQQIEMFKNMNAFRRLGTPEDVAGAINLFLSENIINFTLNIAVLLKAIGYH